MLVLSIIPPQDKLFLSFAKPDSWIHMLCTFVGDSNVGHVFELILTYPSVVNLTILPVLAYIHWRDSAPRLLGYRGFLLHVA